MNFDPKKTLQQIKTSADWFSIRYYKEKNRNLFVRDEQLQENYSSVSEGVMVEVLTNGQFGYVGTDDLSLKGIQMAVDKACVLARSASQWQLHPFSPQQRPAEKGEYKSPTQVTFDLASIAGIASALLECTKKMKLSDAIVSRMAFANLTEASSHFVSSSDADLRQNFSYCYSKLMTTAQKEGIVQSRSNGMPVKQGGLEFFSSDDLLSESERISREVLELLDAPECPSEKLDVLLMPDQLYLQVHESIGHPLEIDRILGDERNYAGWSFINPEDFGSLQFGSKLLNVTFDPTIRNEFAAYAFDDTGVRARKEYIIKDGLLLKGLGSLESQKRSNIEGVACARSTSWNRAPIDRMANLNIEPGQSKLEDMIGSVERGIVMHTNKSWSIDDYRNKFQFGCEYGQLIEDGRLTSIVRNPNYRGMCTPFWRSLKMVGDTNSFKTWGSPFCGKGEPNQVIRVGHAVPACLFHDIEVFGGAQ